MEKNVHERIERDRQANRDSLKKEIETLTRYLNMLRVKEKDLSDQKIMFPYVLNRFVRPEIRNTEELLRRWEDNLKKNIQKDVPSTEKG